ncbi:amidohydrolase family protein [Streptomyces kronopolitis]|uniref:amidohydrolase family protein n=1 Tax=Streptomyces kronopolitis TaxID=1612435 RepID=UPI003D996CC0
MTSANGLPKIAIEEAYEHPDVVRSHLSQDEASLRKLAESLGQTPEYYRKAQELLPDFDKRLEVMDAAGIEHQIISLTSPGIQGVIDPAEATAEARRQNDFLAKEVSQHPDRFSGFAAVALQEPDQAVAELRRSVRDLGFKGVLVNGYTNEGDPAHGRYLDDPVYYPFWEALSELDVPLYLHPRPPLSAVSSLYDGHNEMVGAVWGFATETASHAVRLLLSGHFDRFPTSKLILGHMGEGLPGMLWRVQTEYDMTTLRKIKKSLAEYFADNIWITTSGYFSDQALHNVLLTVGADHILFSVDYPYMEPSRDATSADAVKWIERTAISELDRRKIAYGNARALFGLG